MAAEVMARATPKFIGHSETIRHVLLEIESAAECDAKALITGESGVGKDIAAQLVHLGGRRAARPMVTINCAGIPDSLLESELFGHVRGSFTGAHRDRTGLLETADGGTVFLDEVGEMSLRVQGALLRFVETGEIQRVGSDAVQKRVDVRLIAATNRDLDQRIAAKEFREDLYYRLNVLNIAIPPLRARPEDIPELLRHFLSIYAPGSGSALEVDPDAMARLVNYGWPGNVRQLRNVAERLAVRTRSDRITAADLPADIAEAAVRVDGASTGDKPIADELFERMVKGGEDFWKGPYTMFMARNITRSDLREIIQKGLRQTAGSYKELPMLFNVPPDDYRRFMRVLRQHGCHVPFQQFRPARRASVVRPPAALQQIERRWRRTEVKRVVPADFAASHGRVVDLSYGGMRLACAKGSEVPAVFDVTLPQCGLTVSAERVWTRPSVDTRELWCGAAVIEASGTVTWREFVDAAR
jgi:DNA-binding NtrC family response regulator